MPKMIGRPWIGRMPVVVIVAANTTKLPPETVAEIENVRRHAPGMS